MLYSLSCEKEKIIILFRDNVIDKKLKSYLADEYLDHTIKSYDLCEKYEEAANYIINLKNSEQKYKNYRLLLLDQMCINSFLNVLNNKITTDTSCLSHIVDISITFSWSVRFYERGYYPLVFIFYYSYHLFILLHQYQMILYQNIIFLLFQHF